MNEGKSKLKSIGRVFLLVVISLFLGTRLYAWNAETLAGNAMPMPFGFGISVVLSGSMEPTLSVNDMVVVHEQSNYQINDIVVYQSGSSLIIHRIESIDGVKVITKGDANNVSDQPINVSDIKGRAVFHIPIIGAIGLFMKGPVGFVLIAILAIFLFEYPYWKERKRRSLQQERIKEEIRRLKEK